MDLHLEPYSPPLCSGHFSLIEILVRQVNFPERNGVLRIGFITAFIAKFLHLTPLIILKGVVPRKILLKYFDSHLTLVINFLLDSFVEISILKKIILLKYNLIFHSVDYSQKKDYWHTFKVFITTLQSRTSLCLTRIL